MGRFKIELLQEVKDFLVSLDKKTRDKIIFNLWKARRSNDPELFKKIKAEIWKFRTRYQKKQYRLFAFWDKRDNKNTLVICTHGIIKKTRKISEQDIEKAKKIMIEYLLENQ